MCIGRHYFRFSPLGATNELKFSFKRQNCICAVEQKILICHMPYFEQLWHPTPPPLTPGANFSKSQFWPVGGFLGTLNTMVIFSNLLINVVGHFTLRKNYIFAPHAAPGGGANFYNPQKFIIFHSGSGNI